MGQPSRRVADLLTGAAAELAQSIGANACAISRAVGELLILVAEYTDDGRTLQLGLGFLAADYPPTQEVLASRRPRALALSDPDVDAAEAQLLREYGYVALLMLPLVVDDQVWGLVELYRRDGRFDDRDADAAAPLVERAAAALARGA